MLVASSLELCKWEMRLPGETHCDSNKFLNFWIISVANEFLIQDAMFRAIGAINIITDIALVFLSCAVLWTVQVSLSKKLRIISLLAIRLVVVIAVAFQIHYYIILTNSADKTWAQMNASIWDQAVLNLSIIATSIPSLGRLAHELQPNVNAFAMTENHGLRSRDKYAISSLANHYPRETAEQNMLGTHTSIHGSVDGETESMEGLVRDGIQQNVFISRTVELKVE
ncbi:Hypothetical protein PENO1_072980 [Penicillium occitanis (nom. inval.)]|nr:hypothetical protein PENOC_091050 [Penicillium occitanis (nom. inval.)]PCG95546.1 Hypothetical protein PENO1_072980 [Penicillium occitanis (nom. inval.)]